MVNKCSILYKIDNDNYLKKEIDEEFGFGCNYLYYVNGDYKGSVTSRQLTYTKQGHVEGKEIDDMAIRAYKSYISEYKDFMENYMVGCEVTISNQSLYEKYGRYLRWCRIDKTTEDGQDYYDIYKSWGCHLGMDGETCVIEEIGRDYVLLLNKNGEIDTHIKLSKEEFDCGCIIHKQ